MKYEKEYLSYDTRWQSSLRFSQSIRSHLRIFIYSSHVQKITKIHTSLQILFRRINKTTFILWRTEFYKNYDFIFSHNDHRFYRDSFRISKIRCIINNNEQVLQKNQFHSRKRRLSRIKMNFSLIERFTEKKMKIIHSDHFKSRCQVRRRILKDNLSIYRNCSAFYHDVSFLDWRSIKKNESNNWNNHEICVNEKKKISLRSYLQYKNR
jgi:hypothetical protein